MKAQISSPAWEFVTPLSVRSTWKAWSMPSFAPTSANLCRFLYVVLFE